MFALEGAKIDEYTSILAGPNSIKNTSKPTTKKLSRGTLRLAPQGCGSRFAVDRAFSENKRFS